MQQEGFGIKGWCLAVTEKRVSFFRSGITQAGDKIEINSPNRLHSAQTWSLPSEKSIGNCVRTTDILYQSNDRTMRLPVDLQSLGLGLKQQAFTRYTRSSNAHSERPVWVTRAFLISSLATASEMPGDSGVTECHSWQKRTASHPEPLGIRSPGRTVPLRCSEDKNSLSRYGAAIEP